MMEQYKKCYQSPIYFLKKYTKIQHPLKGAIPFELYQFQQEALKDFVKHSWNIILKSRQLGLSTLTAGYALWMLNFQPDRSILIIANSQQVAMNLIRKIKLMYQSMPTWLREPLTTDNKQSLYFKNNSFVKAASANPNAGVSEALSLLIFDEAAILTQNLASQIWTAAMPTLSTGGDCITGDSIVTILNQDTGLIENINIEELYQRYPRENTI